MLHKLNFLKAGGILCVLAIVAISVANALADYGLRGNTSLNPALMAAGTDDSNPPTTADGQSTKSTTSTTAAGATTTKDGDVKTTTKNDPCGGNNYHARDMILSNSCPCPKKKQGTHRCCISSSGNCCDPEKGSPCKPMEGGEIKPPNVNLGINGTISK